MSRNKKHAFLLAYNGKKYHGCQYNNETETIEKALIESLLHAGLVKDCNNTPSKISLQRCSRTDSGVHASLNVFVANISSECLESRFQSLKECLSEKDIHLYKVIRVSKSFLAQKKCDSRIYEYIVPTFLFERSTYESDTMSYSSYFVVLNEEKDEDVLKLEHDRGESFESDLERVKRFEIGDLEPVRAVFRNYVGTRDYHNFTFSKNTKGKLRYIKSVDVSPAFRKDDVEYVKITLHGQSFLYNQVRKMVGHAIERIRYSREGRFFDAFTETKVNILKAPSQYLLLERPVFGSYNESSRRNHEPIQVDEDVIQHVKRGLIYSEILRAENLLHFFKWLACACKYKIGAY